MTKHTKTVYINIALMQEGSLYLKAASRHFARTVR